MRTRRIVAAMAVMGMLVVGMPGSATAETVCSTIVCAYANTEPFFECDVQPDPMTGYRAVCGARANAVAYGYSQLMLPGYAEWSASADCVWLTGAGEVGCGHADQDPVLCSWPGLGQNACGGYFLELLGPISVPLSPGECVAGRLAAMESDVLLSVQADVSVFMAVLVVPAVDHAEWSDLTQIFLSDTPASEDTCAPSA